MTTINFPDSPSSGQTHTENGLTFEYNGTSWELVREIGYLTGPDYPITLPAPNPMTGQTEDIVITRANATYQAADPTTLDDTYVYIFEVRHSDIDNIFGPNNVIEDVLAANMGMEIKLKNIETNAYLQPTSFLEFTWKYNVATLASILEIPGDKTIRISDEGKMLITLKSEYGFYSYLMYPTDPADIPEEGPDPDSPAYQYEQANNNN